MDVSCQWNVVAWFKNNAISMKYFANTFVDKNENVEMKMKMKI